jgi:hypothetical protein
VGEVTAFFGIVLLGEYRLIGYKSIGLEARISFCKTSALNHAIKNTNVKRIRQGSRVCFMTC